MVISPKYDKTDGFKNGVARVKLDGKFGFIDRHGKEVIKPVYDYISDLANNMYILEKDGKVGILRIE